MRRWLVALAAACTSCQWILGINPDVAQVTDSGPSLDGGEEPGLEAGPSDAVGDSISDAPRDHGAVDAESDGPG